MTETIYTGLAHLMIINVLIGAYALLYPIKNKASLLLFNFMYLAFYTVTVLPAKYAFISSVLPGKWNWEGKILSIILVFVFYLCVKKKRVFFLPKNLNINKAYAFIVILFALLTNFWMFPLIDWSSFNAETFWFQLFIPSISEELFFRSILLGLMSNYMFTEKRADWFNIIVVSVLFALGHAFFITADFELGFSFGDSVSVFLFGIFWAWLTLRSKSVMYSIFSHSLENIGLAFM